MKGILEFTLPDDEQSFRIAAEASKLYSALDDIRQFIRTKEKYGEPSKEVIAILDEIKKIIPALEHLE